MIKIIKLVNGEQLIGDVQNRETVDSGGFSYKVLSPMYIDSTDDGGQTLRDALIISSEEDMTFRSADIITMFNPVNIFEVFYLKTVEYAKLYGRPYALAQIKEALAYVEEMMQQDEKRKKRLVNILSTSNSVTSVH